MKLFHDILPRRTRSFRQGSILLLAVCCAASLSAQLPAKLTDAEYWKMVTDFSEPAGYFQSENFTSNETAFQTVIPELLRTTKPGGVYLGVGPEQNFTYIAALKPAMVFIVDIRRQNMLQHLIYKALFETYTNRADFLSHLFSVPRPAGLDSNSTADALFAAMAAGTPDSGMYRRTLDSITTRLTKTHGFTLTPDDLDRIRRVFDAFYLAGPRLNYSFTPENGFGGGGGRGGGRGMPSFHELMIQNDGLGTNRNFLANEANYRFLRELHQKNLLVAVVGDFAGPKAIKSVADYLKAAKVTVTAFYCSNVEQYLFQNNVWRAFYTNVATLPLDSTSTFIRSVANQGRGGGGGARFTVPNTGYVGGGMRLPSVLAPMLGTLTAFTEGRVLDYQSVIYLSHQGN